MAIDDNDFVVLDDNDVGDYNAEGTLPESPETIQKIQKWLQPTDFAADSSEHKKHLISYVAGTGNWIQETETYQAWHDSSESASLWIKAIPGAGKSVFAAMIADKLARTEKAPVLYFFFRQIIAKNHDPQYLVRDWLCQLLPYSPSLQFELKGYMEGDQSLDDIPTDGLWLILLHAMELIPKVYCVADALDEMDISKLGFLNSLVELGKQKHSTVKVLMTSRPLPRIESILRAPSILQISILQIRLRQNMVDTDIAVYVNHRLREHADMSLTEEIRETVRNAICTNGQGSFLYARLMMDNLLEDTTRIGLNGVDLEQLMKKLPISLEDMYNAMLLDHATRSGVPQELQLTILQWVTHSVRPLRLLELAATIDSLNETERKATETKALARKACGPLLEILEDETVSIIHHSFTEFLVDQGREERALQETRNFQFPVIKSTDTHRLLALTCLRYLTSGSLDACKPSPVGRRYHTHSEYLGEHKDAKMAHPFLDYAALNVCSHVSKIGSADEMIFALLDEFMREDNPAFISWLEFTWPARLVQNVSPLHVAAHHGILNYCQHLIQAGQDVNRVDDGGRTPISWASTKGHTKIAAILLGNGAKANSSDKTGLKPVHYAAKANQFEVVRLLLAAGVDPLTARVRNRPGRRCDNAESEIAQNALLYACQRGCAETVIEFMKYVSPKQLDRALGCAAHAGRANVVAALLESPYVTVDSTDWGPTPLYSASRVQNPAMMKALLQKGANPNARSIISHRTSPTRIFKYSFDKHEERGETPLHSLAGGVYQREPTGLDGEDIRKECCKLLLDAGGDVNAIGRDGNYPIHYSTSPAITSMLLEYGAKAMVTSEDGSTPLHFACEMQAPEKLVGLLVQHGADINAKRHVDGKRPIHLILKSPSPCLLESFLAYVPDVNAKDGNGNTPLHSAVQQHYSPTENKVQILLDAGADPNQANLNMECPIHMIKHGRMGHNLSMISNLLNAGADLEARDNLGRTILLRCMDDTKAAKELLGLGAKIGPRDVYGHSVLHLMCQGHALFPLDLLTLLVEAGADVNWVNHEGNTVLHEASKLRPSTNLVDQVRFLEALLKLGVPVNRKNYSGATPLHIACSGKPRPGTDHIWKAIIDLLLGPKFGIGIDEGDNNGARAIHFAANVSDRPVLWLVDSGADPAVHTIEGQTPLQVACRARQTNIVGALVEIYMKRGQSHLIDWKDKTGRTALHYACRSGRPETVRLLLEAGAQSNLKDRLDYTPLHVCAEFVEENVIWSSRYALQDETTRVMAANVLIGDSHHPVGQIPCSPSQIPFSMWDCDIRSEHHTVRIRESIRLLIAHGADINAICQSYGTPLSMALCAGCEVMVDELLPATTKGIDENEGPSLYGSGLGDDFARQYLRLRSLNAPRLVEDMATEGEESFQWNKLLRLDDERLIEELIKRRVDFFNQKTKREAFPATLAAWGYATILEKFGREVAIYHDPSRVEDFVKSTACQFQPLLHIACRRELPNMEVVRILVEKFGVDINARTTQREDSMRGQTALHILASGQHRWQIQAIEYILERGADVELENGEGESPLLICVNDNKYQAGCWRNAVADVLLRYGANPNVLDKRGLTCLNLAGSNTEMVRNLINYGADVNSGDTPALFTAIASYGLANIQVILDSGEGLNSRRKENRQPYRMPIREIPPLHYASSNEKNLSYVNSRRECALQVVRLFLERGADPFEVINAETTVVHDLLANWGVLTPYLELPGLDLERRDPQGRTLLLAGCTSPYLPVGHVDLVGRVEDDEPIVASILYEMGADITARDNRGLNALHCLLLASHRESKRRKKIFLDIVRDAPLLIHQKDQEGNTPLHYALRMARIWSIEPLLSAGSATMEPDSEGNTALHSLTRMATCSNLDKDKTEWFQLFKKFLALGVSINAKNKRGETPLFTCLASDFQRYHLSNPRVIRDDISIFQEAGADFLARNNDMETLLHITAKRVNTGCCSGASHGRECVLDCFKCLMELGCDPLAEDINQRTALDVAAACGNDNVLKLFKRDGDSKNAVPKKVP